ncbi:ABC transporter ATP-binding protein [Advenella alkanexedens]|uniref:ABC transporter ATP-binding protein n=1 Tax=Advenella alkanexedens TaxID=1481665 RepID=UPI002676C559|nr:ABC transporter ATP-binding protein [Advenella alkanexedens]WKU19701.1 ABC transporter ATP-binding protein [Advenella alkanexedens]
MSEAPVLSVEQLHVHYRQREVLSGVNLENIRPGELVALVGPNAAGKSTLLKAIAGLVPAAGRIRYGDDDWSGWPLRKRVEHIGFMPQSVPESSTLTVLEATLVALRCGQPGVHKNDELDALRMIEHLGIGDLALRPLYELSGGQRQLAALAQAVVRGSPVLLLDEPVSALDLAHQWQVMNVARRLADEGRIVMVVLHDLALAAQWANGIAILHKRQIHSFGAPNEIITNTTLREVWGVQARVRTCEQGRPFVLVDALATQADMTAKQQDTI